MKTKTIAVIAIATLGLLAVSGAALTVAAKGGRDGVRMQMFEQLDRDGDGRVEAAEGRAVIAERFAAYDADGDGILSLAEFETLHAELMRPRTVDHFQRIDADGDAEVTLDELTQPFDQMLRWRDADGDGALDASDFRAMAGRRGHGRGFGPN